MRILVASPGVSTRKAVGMLIDTQTDCDLVGEAADIANLLLQVKRQQPDLIVLDWESLGSQIDTLQELLKMFDQPPTIIALSVKEQSRHAAVESGAVGFAYMGDPPDRLMSAIRDARRHV